VNRIITYTMNIKPQNIASHAKQTQAAACFDHGDLKPACAGWKLAVAL
jgi:hypothetical protein